MRLFHLNITKILKDTVSFGIMMKLSVPFIPDPSYSDFIAARQNALASVYFTLDGPGVWDARVRTRDQASGPFMPLARGLSPLKHVKKYVLINTRFVHPGTYSNTRALVAFMDAVTRLSGQVRVHGIVFSDFYLLRALDRTGHDIIPSLEAVPGVNAMMDTMGKVRACLDMVATTQFRPPSRLLLDRSLNRQMDRLTAIRQKVRQEYPDTCVELLANEGCILNCPFKPAHDAHIALSNTGLVREKTWTINRNQGCQAYFLDRPDRFLSSPFIRPEDLGHYQGLADTVKLCGRTLGPDFLMRCITAYETGSFDGNLLDLVDAAHFLSDHFHIENRLLGKNFFKALSSCTNQCKTCTLCRKIFQSAARIKPFTLKFYKDI